MLTVKELKKALEDYGDDDMVVLPTDNPDGFGYSPLSGTSPHMYLPKDEYTGDLFPLFITAGMKKEGYTEEFDATDDPNARKCITLYPSA